MKKFLWLVGRNNLVEQTAERFIDNDLCDVGLLNGHHRNYDNQIIIASIQSISKSNVLKKFKKDQFHSIFVDEAHHAAASSYQKVLSYFNSAKKVGLTATPDRPDGLEILKDFGKPIFEQNFKAGQKLGVLAKHITYAILTDATIGGIPTKSGEYSAKSLERLYTVSGRNQLIVDSYIRYAKTPIKKLRMKPKAICFCINVAHAKRMSELFNSRNIKSAYICGNAATQSFEERKELEEKFKNTNEIEILCSVDLMNEGVDISDANIALMARPTRSPIIYTQQVGRVARIDEGKKKKFIVLDFIDNCRKEYHSYTMGHKDGSKGKNTTVVVDYLNCKDKIAVSERVEDFMKGVEDFVTNVRTNYDLLLKYPKGQRIKMIKDHLENGTKLPGFKNVIL